MSDLDVSAQIQARLEAAGLSIPAGYVTKLATYLQLLARWNRRINLTALPVDPPTASAIDRLLVEPAQAARFVRPEDRAALDIGSGGGSPALPIRILSPALHMTLVESRGKKAAFLREAARHLDLAGVTVENERLEVVAASPAHQGRYSLVSMRAVRADPALWAAIGAVTTTGARLLWFRSEGDEEPGQGWRAIADEVLVGGPANRLTICQIGY